MNYLPIISKAKTQTWHGTVAGVLSVSNKTLFKSGVSEFGEAGWWALMETKPPELRPEISSKNRTPHVDKTVHFS